MRRGGLRQINFLRTVFGIAFYQSNLSTPSSEINEIMIKDDIDDILYIVHYNCIRTGIVS